MSGAQRLTGQPSYMWDIFKEIEKNMTTFWKNEGCKILRSYCDINFCINFHKNLRIFLKNFGKILRNFWKTLGNFRKILLKKNKIVVYYS